MDLEQLKFRASILRKIREFFWQQNFLELDTPALSKTLIPESCLEVFKTEYISPKDNSLKPLYLVPSPEIYIKQILAQYPVSVFQLSKCYRNIESCGRIHNPEFTMLEYYITDASYIESAALTEELFSALLPDIPTNDYDPFNHLRPPFIRLSMDEAFHKFAGFYLSDCPHPKQLAVHAIDLGLYQQDQTVLFSWTWDDLYELILVQCIEPQLPHDKPVFLMDYPAKVPCLARDVPNTDNQHDVMWKERWELYVQGIELANCYSEETDPEKIKEYFALEGAVKNRTAKVPHAIDPDYWMHFTTFPNCSGTAMGIDRLIAVLAGCKTIEPYLSFPFTLE